MKKYFSYTIFIIMSSAAIFGGYFSLKLSFKKESNIKRLANLYKPNKPIAVEPPQNDVNEHVLGSRSETFNDNVRPCVASESAILNKTNSIVDFLYYQKKDYSFAGRLVLAKKYNIPDYVGNTHQNMLLLAILKLELKICKNDG